MPSKAAKRREKTSPALKTKPPPKLRLGSADVQRASRKVAMYAGRVPKTTPKRIVRRQKLVGGARGPGSMPMTSRVPVAAPYKFLEDLIKNFPGGGSSETSTFSGGNVARLTSRLARALRVKSKVSQTRFRRAPGYMHLPGERHLFNSPLEMPPGTRFYDLLIAQKRKKRKARA